MPLQPLTTHFLPVKSTPRAHQYSSNCYITVIVVLLCLLIICASWIAGKRILRRRRANYWSPHQPWDIAMLTPAPSSEHKDSELDRPGPFIPFIVCNDHISECGFPEHHVPPSYIGGPEKSTDNKGYLPRKLIRRT